MEIILLPTALADLSYWKGSGNTIVLKRIRQLLDAIKQILLRALESLKRSNTTGQVCGSVELTKNTDLFTK